MDFTCPFPFANLLSAKLAFSQPDYSTLLKALHTASFFIRDVKSSKVKANLDNERVTAILKNGPRILRRLRVNNLQWEVCRPFVIFSGGADEEQGCWECTTDSGMNFVIRQFG